MIKYILSAFILFMLVGCKNQLREDFVAKKENLITKAESGDIDSMVTLNKDFFYTTTKEGFDYNRAWYDSVLASSDSNAILSFAHDFQNYDRFLLDGKEQSLSLLLRASELGNQQANMYLLNTKYNKNKLIDERILAGDSIESMAVLLKHYEYNRRKPGISSKIDHLKSLIKEKEALIAKSDFDAFENIYDKKVNSYNNSEINANYKNHIDEILLSNDEGLILEVGNYIKEKNDRSSLEFPFYKKLVELNEKNIKYNKLLVESYYSLSEDKQEEYETEIVKVLKRISYTDDYDSSLKLLSLYTKEYSLSDEYFNDLEDGINRNKPIVIYVFEPSYIEKKIKEFFRKDEPIPATRKRVDDMYPQEYPEFITHLSKSKMNESKRALGEFYYKKREFSKSLDILNSLAKSGNKEAIMYIADKIDTRNAAFSKSAYKWANYIVESKDPILIRRLAMEVNLNFSDSKKSTEIKNKINDLYENDKAFITVNNLIEKYNAMPFSDKDVYLNNLVGKGEDVTFYHLSSKSSLRSKDIEEVNDALKSNHYLAEKNHLHSILNLASFYKKPPGIVKNKQDFDTSLSYYSKAVDLGELSLIREIFCMYKCGDIKRETSPNDDKEINRYVDILVNAKEGGTIIKNLALVYCCYTEPKNFQQSIYYFIKASEAGYIGGLAAAARLYKNNLNDEENYLKYMKAGVANGDQKAAAELNTYLAGKN